MGGNFPGGNFPGENFPRTALSLLFLTEALNHRLYDFKFFVNNSFVDSLFYNVNFEIYGIIRRLKLNICFLVVKIQLTYLLIYLIKNRPQDDVIT